MKRIVDMDGKQVWPRKNNGEFKKSPKNHKWAKRGMAVLAVTIFALAIYGDHWTSKELSVTVPTAYAGETMTAKVDALKIKLIDEMQGCEYTGWDQDNAIPKIDNNSKGTLPTKDILSYGPMQWKISTMQRMYKQLNGVDLTNYQAILMAMDGKRAREIALDAWLNIKGSINEWSCATEQMKAQVEDIRFLTQ